MINDQKILAVIPARSGSKGVEGKNYKILNGKPLVQWSIEDALESKYIDEIVVSSNCDKVREIVDDIKDLGIPKLRYLTRPEELCGDISTSESAIIHAYKNAKNKWNFDAYWVMLLQPTSPIRKNNLIDKAIEKLVKKPSKDSLMTVSSHTPFFIKKSDQGQLYWFYDPQKRPMRQELKDSDLFWHDDGSIYITRSDILVDSECRIGKDVVLFENAPEGSVQIDTELDFKIVGILMEEIS